MADKLASGPDGSGPSQPSDGVVQPLLQNPQQDFTRVALGARGFVHVEAELTLEDVVVIAELLFFVQTHTVVTQSPAPEAVGARGVELSLGGVFGKVGDGDADAAGEFDLGACVVGHETRAPSLLRLPRGCGFAGSATSGRVKPCAQVKH